jgi:hypothetical protein
MEESKAEEVHTFPVSLPYFLVSERSQRADSLRSIGCKRGPPNETHSTEFEKKSQISSVSPYIFISTEISMTDVYTETSDGRK